MGNICNGQSHNQQRQINQLQFRKQNTQFSCKRITLTDRFKHQIQKLKIDGTNMYKLILPVDGQRQQTKSIQCKFLFSYADMQMCPQYQFSLQDMTRFPIIDVFEPQNIINPQIYHKIVTQEGKRKLMKYYNFSSFTDYQFKCALYQLSLYKTMQNSKLQDYFVIFKGNTKQLVMIFDYCYVSLHDVLYYRKITNYHWDQRQLLIIMKMLCQNLVQLAQVDIVHRDIRPSNIFFHPITIINSGDSNMDMNQIATHLVNQSVQSDQFYTLFNLQSARMIDPANLKQDGEQNDDILTIKGSPVFNQSTVRQALQRNQHKANYNPYQNDILGLKHTLLSLVNLQPTNVGTNHQDRFIHKSKVKQLVRYLSSPQGLTIQKVSQYVSDLLGINHTNKKNSYYDIIRTFYIKQLTICQNIETNLYFNNSRQSNLSLINQSFPTNSINPNIQSQAVPSSSNNFEYIQSLYIKTLYDLQKKDIFVAYMLEKLSKNFQINKKQQNVILLMKVGKYFQDSGVKENQYYKQAILLLLELAEEQRLQGFNKDHQRLVNQAEEVYQKFDPSAKIITRAKCMLLKQRAYKDMFLNNDLIPGQYSPYDQNRFQNVQKVIFQAYQQSQKANLPIEQQLQLIYSKGQLSLYMQKGQQAETFFFNGYQIAQKNYKEFMTAHNCSKYKGMFQYAMALVQMTKLKTGNSQRTPKTVFEIQQKLQKAKQRFSSVKIHPVLIIKCYIALGDLNLIRQDHQNAIKNYERALNLLHAQNQVVGQGIRTISARIERQIVRKLMNVLSMGSNSIQSRKYETLYSALNKQFNMSRTSQRRYSRKGRSSTNSSRLESRINRQQGNQKGLQVIKQEQEDNNNKMFESQGNINNGQNGSYLKSPNSQYGYGDKPDIKYTASYDYRQSQIGVQQSRYRNNKKEYSGIKQGNRYKNEQQQGYNKRQVVNEIMQSGISYDKSDDSHVHQI